MTAEYAQKIINSPFFSEFLAPAADRHACLTAWLNAQGIPARTVALQDRAHIFVKFPASAYSSRFKMKTLIAHYDRAAGTPGANDNSAACIQLLLFAKMLLQKNGVHNIRIIFTDGEEAGKQGIKSQGAYRLGQGLRALAMQHDDIFVFDLCGTGDTLIISESGMYGRDKKKTGALTALHRRSCVYADASCRGHWLSLPTAYSDNAGLISAGLAAQVITVLPRAEAELLMRILSQQASQGLTAGSQASSTRYRAVSKSPYPSNTATHSKIASPRKPSEASNKANIPVDMSATRGKVNAPRNTPAASDRVNTHGNTSTTSGKADAPGDTSVTSRVPAVLSERIAESIALQSLQQSIITNQHIAAGSPLAAVIPQTWQRMHTPHDSLENLTPPAFVIMDKFLRYLAAAKEPVL